MLNKPNNSIESRLLIILQQGSQLKNVRGEHKCKFLSRTQVQVFYDLFSDKTDLRKPKHHLPYK